MSEVSFNASSVDSVQVVCFLAHKGMLATSLAQHVYTREANFVNTAVISIVFQESYRRMVLGTKSRTTKLSRITKQSRMTYHTFFRWCVSWHTRGCSPRALRDTCTRAQQTLGIRQSPR